MWLDGYSAGNHEWKTYGYRDWDVNNKPEEITDLSFERNWFSEVVAVPGNGLPEEVFSPKRLPVKMRMPLGFCDAGSTHKFIMKGKWKTPIAEISPQIVFRMNASHEVFHWDFREGDKVKGPHSYHVWARERRTNKTPSVVTLSEMDLSLKKIPDFNLTITCVDFNATGTFKVQLNYPRNLNCLERTLGSLNFVLFKAA